MEDTLAIYLDDHLAGSKLAADLLTALQEKNKGSRLGEFAREMLAGVESDRAVLQSLIDRVDTGSSPAKHAVAWLGEKLSRLKLSSFDGLGTFEALELLELGVTGKLLMWRALALAAVQDARLRGFNFDELAGRAQSQQMKLEERRLEIAAPALAVTKATPSGPR
jgi:hypothetical protein